MLVTSKSRQLWLRMQTWERYFRPSRICSNSSLMSESLSFRSRGLRYPPDGVKLARGDLVSLDRVALAVKCSHVLEETAGDFWRQFERFAARFLHPGTCQAVQTSAPR